MWEGFSVPSGGPKHWQVPRTQLATWCVRSIKTSAPAPVVVCQWPRPLWLATPTPACQSNGCNSFFQKRHWSPNLAGDGYWCLGPFPWRRAPPSPGQAEVLTLLLRLEAVVVAAAAAVPEASALVVLAVEEPHHGEALASARVLLQGAVACRGQHSAQERARTRGRTCVCVCFTSGTRTRSSRLQQHVWICGGQKSFKEELQQETGSSSTLNWMSPSSTSRGQV